MNGRKAIEGSIRDALRAINSAYGDKFSIDGTVTGSAGNDPSDERAQASETADRALAGFDPTKTIGNTFPNLWTSE